MPPGIPFARPGPADEFDVEAIADHWLARFGGYRRRPKEPGRHEASGSDL
jgi:hypothetical protein